MDDYLNPLSIFFVMHPQDKEVVDPLFEECFACLRRDADKPFSRSVNVPVFVRTCEDGMIPSAVTVHSKRAIIFTFIGKNCMSDEGWVDYLQSLANTDRADLVPIALDKTAFNFSGGIEKINFIRAYEYPSETFKERVCLSVFHEIYRFGLNQDRKKLDRGKESALKLFLSHAKDGAQGVAVATALKHFIENGPMRNFFDATDIASGYEFESEIIAHIKDSTVIALHSDSYSSRYWCQREILAAKDADRPILGIDIVKSFEDRRFPLGGNLPVIRIQVGADNEISENILLHILQAALLETIRCFYSKETLRIFQAAGWFSKNAYLSVRPPEACVLARLAAAIDAGENDCLDFVYPDPPIYDQEARHFVKFGLKAYTPLTSDNPDVKNKAVGISISEPSDKELRALGLMPQHLSLLMQEIARYGLGYGAELVYGGDLRPGGFTEFLFQEGHALQSRIQNLRVHITNHIAWPIHLADEHDLRDWKAKHRKIATMVEHDIPADVEDLVNRHTDFVAPTAPSGSFIWSRSLTEMRRAMIADCDIRISAGGRLTGYKGWMPGVMEEIAISVELGKPIFLLGGFGGVTRSVCQLISEKAVPEELSFDWQVDNNPTLKGTIDFARSRGFEYEDQYKRVLEIVAGAELRNGLSQEENAKLFESTFVEESIHLILKGIAAI